MDLNFCKRTEDRLHITSFCLFGRHFGGKMGAHFKVVKSQRSWHHLFISCFLFPEIACEAAAYEGKKIIFWFVRQPYAGFRHSGENNLQCCCFLCRLTYSQWSSQWSRVWESLIQCIPFCLFHHWKEIKIMLCDGRASQSPLQLTSFFSSLVWDRTQCLEGWGHIMIESRIKHPLYYGPIKENPFSPSSTAHVSPK